MTDLELIKLAKASATRWFDANVFNTEIAPDELENTDNGAQRAWNEIAKGEPHNKRKRELFLSVFAQALRDLGV